MLVKPSHPSQDLAFSRRLIAAAQEDAELVRADLTADGAGGAGCQLRFGGNPAALTEESALLKRTVVMNGVVSFAGSYFTTRSASSPSEFTRSIALPNGDIATVTGLRVAIGARFVMSASATGAKRLPFSIPLSATSANF